MYRLLLSALFLPALVLGACATPEAPAPEPVPGNGQLDPAAVRAEEQTPLRNPDVARVLGLETGDRACYLSLEDEQGVPFFELAAFSLCEQQEIVGRRVRLEYAQARVPSEACAGDPACTETDEVAIVQAVALVDE